MCELLGSVMNLKIIVVKKNFSLQSNKCHHFIFSYNSSTGVFTVPPGGDGVYYFSVYLTGDHGEGGFVDMKHNDANICRALGDNSESGHQDAPATSCSAIVNAVAGNV